MCSRFWGAPDGQRVLTAWEQFGPVFEGVYKPGPRKQNTAPTESVLSLQPREIGLEMLEIDEWGFTIPNSSQRFINGKIETVLQRSLFSRSARERRCILPAEGFFEWRGEKGAKEPILFSRTDGQMMGLGGLWREVNGKTEVVVLTTLPNSLVAEVHDRMPVIIRDAAIDEWLRGDPIEAVGSCIEPFPVAQLVSRAVTKAVSSPRYAGDLNESVINGSLL